MGAVVVDAQQHTHAARCGRGGAYVRSSTLNPNDALFSALLVLGNGSFEVEIADDVAAVCQ